MTLHGATHAAADRGPQQGWGRGESGVHSRVWAGGGQDSDRHYTQLVVNR